MIMTKTSILPNAIQLPAGKIKSEQLVPWFEPKKQTGFFGIKSGKIHPHGLIVDLKSALSAEDLLKMIQERHKVPVPKKEALAILEKYVTALQEYKSGNVIFIRYSRTGDFSLDKVAENPPAGQKSF
ncbi:MAG: hypothetical protein HBSIN02_01450 [Bacteroidia bacterium]|nr:MAG: hypothetical protein HBSIN02_01450 [Bacteroidia bacterium]